MFGRRRDVSGCSGIEGEKGRVGNPTKMVGMQKSMRMRKMQVYFHVGIPLFLYLLPRVLSLSFPSKKRQKVTISEIRKVVACGIV
jgi:hypothetical protein